MTERRKRIEEMLEEAHRFRTCFHKLEYQLYGMNECLCSDEKCDGYNPDCEKYSPINKVDDGGFKDD